MLESAPLEVQNAIRAYFPQEEWENAAAISKCESGWNSRAWNQAGEDSRGLFQINVQAHPNAGNMFDITENVAYASRLWRDQGWRPWACASLLGIMQGTPSRDSSPIAASGTNLLAVVFIIGLVWLLWPH